MVPALHAPVGLPPCCPQFVDDCRNNLKQIANDAKRSDFENGRVRIPVDCHDIIRPLHADKVLDRAADTDSDIEPWSDRLAGLANLLLVRAPTGVNDGTRGADRGTQLGRELLN